MKRRILGTLLGLAMGLGLTQANADQTFKIGYSQFWGTNPFLITQINGAKKAIEEWKAKGVKIDMIVTNGGDTDTTKQVADLEDLHAQGIQGLLLFPGDSIVLAEPVKNIYNKENIPVVVTDIGLNSGKWVTFIITDNTLLGRLGAEEMAKAVKPGAKVIVFDCAPGNNNAQARRKGFEERAKELGLTVLPRKLLKLSLEDSRKTMEDTLTSIPDIAGVFHFNPVTAEGASTALDAAKRHDVQLVSSDLDPVSYKMVKDGKILALIVQDPFKMGYEGMNAMVTKLQGGTPPERMDLKPKTLTKANAADFANDPQVALLQK